MAQTFFKRYEQKYLLDKERCADLAGFLSDKTKPDKYGAYIVSSLYYDTDGYDLIRASIEKPLYKEKLRLRSYGIPERGTTVFCELKKKYKGVVYKRRMLLPYEDACDFLAGSAVPEGDTQVRREIEHFLSSYKLSARASVTYERKALAADDGLRITFDTNVRFSCSLPDGGSLGGELLRPELVLMEIKTPLAIPLWLSGELSRLGIYPSSFSKYGTGYTKYILGNTPKEVAAGA